MRLLSLLYILNIATFSLERFNLLCSGPVKQPLSNFFVPGPNTVWPSASGAHLHIFLWGGRTALQHLALVGHFIFLSFRKNLQIYPWDVRALSPNVCTVLKVSLLHCWEPFGRSHRQALVGNFRWIRNQTYCMLGRTCDWMDNIFCLRFFIRSPFCADVLK